MTRHAPIFAILSMLLGASSGCGGAAPAASLEEARNSADLAAELKTLRESVPDQAHVMADVGDHFTNLWFAGKAENWPLADFYLSETKSHLRWAVRVKPIRKDNSGREINLPGILEAFENTQLAQLKKAVDGHDPGAFQAVYRDSLTACYGCHKASDKPYLRPRVPGSPASNIINFDPKADWPR
jgi:hypothetical protein